MLESTRGVRALNLMSHVTNANFSECQVLHDPIRSPHCQEKPAIACSNSLGGRESFGHYASYVEINRDLILG
eukprot:scaffold8234_cov116-Cylindrotheca_fusiformis.AAC.2